MKRRVSIKAKLTRVVLLIALSAVLLVSMAALFFMFSIKDKSESAVIEEMKSRVSGVVAEKVANAEMSINTYSDCVDLSSTLVEMLYRNPEKYHKLEVPLRTKDSPKEYLMQRSFINTEKGINDVNDELSLLANMESIWQPFMKKYGETIATIYLGTETGFMLSYDNNANMAEYSENGEVYFDHINRPWYKLAKKEGKMIFTDLTQDYFGRGLSLTCAKPFYNNNEFAGVVAMDILVSDLQQTIIDIDIAQDHEEDYAFLINDDGNIIASPFIDKDATTFENIKEKDNKFYPISEKLLNEKQGIELVDDFYCIYSPIETTDWTLCVYVPQSIILQPVHKLEAIIRFMTNVFIVLFLITFVVVSVIIYMFSKELVRPLELLQEDVKIISSGNLDNTARVLENDEIGDLAIAFNNMTKSLKQYINDLTSITAEKERIGAELNVATHIQSSMLPSIFPAFPNDTRFDIYATMNPAKEVGGDFYDFFMIDDKHLAIVVADVSGKGVPAALFMVIGKTLIKDHTSLTNNLTEVFYKVNNILCESNSENLFITAFEAVINIETGHLTYVNAGHELPYIYKKGKDWNAYPMKAGFVLAGMEDMKFTTGEFYLEPGDKVFQYTDGVTEATNINNELYGMDRLKKILDTCCDKNMEELLSAVKKDIDSFVGDAPQFDDITMLGFEYKGI